MKTKNLNNLEKKALFNRDNIYSFLSSVTAIIIGLIIGFIILLITNYKQALPGLKAILVGAFSDRKNLGQVFYFATPVILTGLSVGFANKTGLFNIGASGQVITGGFVAVYIGVKWTFLPGALHWIVALLGAMVIGGLWGFLPGFLKAKFNVNEVISCIMMNYIGMYLTNFIMVNTVYDSKRNESQKVAANATLPSLGMDKFFKSKSGPSSINIGIFIAIFMGILMWVILEKTSFGYELKACGYNKDASKYAGINETKSIVLSMMIAGALAGLGGGLIYLSSGGKRIEALDVLVAEGFNGIPVSLLGLNNPIGIIFSGLFIAYLNMGGFVMQLSDYPVEVIEIIISVVIYFSAFSLFMKDWFKKIQLKFSKNSSKSVEEGEN